MKEITSVLCQEIDFQHQNGSAADEHAHCHVVLIDYGMKPFTLPFKTTLRRNRWYRRKRNPQENFIAQNRLQLGT